MKTIIIHLNTAARGDVAWSIEQLLVSPEHNVEKIHLGDDGCLFKVSDLEPVTVHTQDLPPEEIPVAQEVPAQVPVEPALAPEEVPPQPEAPADVAADPSETTVGPCYVMGLSSVHQVMCFFDSQLETSKLCVTKIIEKSSDTISFLFCDMTYRYPCAADSCAILCGVRLVGSNVTHPCLLEVIECAPGEPCKVVLGNDCSSMLNSNEDNSSYVEVPAQ